MSTERLDIVVREDGSRVVRRNIAGIGTDATKAATGVRILQRAMLGLTVGAGLLFLQRQVDEYTNLQNRLRLVTKNSSELKKVNDELFTSANRTRSEFSATVDLYASLARSSKELGVSQKDLMTVTEAVNMAVKISGTETATAAMGIRQLGQALASGVLRGDEFNSIMENMPRVAQAIASSMGVSLGALRKLAAEGKVTAREIVVALRAAAPQLQAEFEKITPTISDAFTVLRNNVLKFVGEANAASGVAQALSGAIMTLAKNLDLLVQVVLTAAAAFVIWKATLAVSAVIAYVRGLMALQMALGATAGQAFVTGVAMRGLKGAMAFLLSPVTLGTMAVLALAAALISMAMEAAEASAILSGLEQSSHSAAMELLDMEAKARAAGMNVDSLTNAAMLGNPIIANIAKTYGVAADEAKRLAINARQAAIQVAQGKVAELTAQRDSLLAPIKRSSSMIAQGGAVAGIGGLYKFGRELIGPSDAERKAGAGTLNDQIGIYQRQLGILSKAPDTFFADDPVPGGGGGGDKKKDKKGSDAQTRAGFLEQLNRETNNSIQLTGILDDEWRAVQGQITGINEQMTQNKWAALTEGETFALQQKIEKLRENEELMQMRDDLARRFTQAAKEELRVNIAAQQLLDAGIIKQEDYVRAIEDARLAVLDLAEDGASGLERGLIRVTQQARNEAARLENAVGSIWQNTRGPQLAFEAGLKAINKLLEANKIDALEARRATRDLRIEYLQTKTDLGSGLELGKLNVQRDNENVGGRAAQAYADEYRNVNGAMQDIQDRASAIKQLMQDDPINSGQYALRLRELGIEALQMQVNLPGANAFDAVKGALASFVSDFKGVLPGLQAAWGNFFQRLGDGAANALARAVVYGENLGDALRDVARSALTELISGLIKMGIQWLVMQVIGQTAMAAISATGVAAGLATAAAWAPAAAAVSLATFGANAGPAMAGIGMTYALTKALSMAGFKDGGYTGNGGVSDIAGVVHGKEFVFDADAVDRLGLPFLEALRSGRPGYKSGGYVKPLSGAAMTGANGGAAPSDGGNSAITFHIDARGSTDEDAVEQKIEQALEQALPYFLKASRNQEDRVWQIRGKRQRLGGSR